MYTFWSERVNRRTVRPQTCFPLWLLIVSASRQSTKITHILTVDSWQPLWQSFHDMSALSVQLSRLRAFFFSLCFRMQPHHPNAQPAVFVSRGNVVSKRCRKESLHRRCENFWPSPLLSQCRASCRIWARLCSVPGTCSLRSWRSRSLRWKATPPPPPPRTVILSLALSLPSATRTKWRPWTFTASTETASYAG